MGKAQWGWARATQAVPGTYAKLTVMIVFSCVRLFASGHRSLLTHNVCGVKGGAKVAPNVPSH